MTNKTLILPVGRESLGKQTLTKGGSEFWVGLALIVGVLVGAYVHYNAANVFSITLQIIVLVLYFRSPSNFPWLLILFFVAFKPGAMFSSNAKPLVLFSTDTFGAVTFEMSFVLVSWLKVLNKRLNPIVYQRNYLLFLAYMLVLVAIFGAKPVSLIRQLLFFSWLLVIPNLLDNQSDINRLFYLIFMVNILLLLSNIYQIVTGYPMITLFTKEYLGRVYSDTETLIRTAEGIPFALLSVIGGLYYLSKERNPIPNMLAYSGLFIGLLNIIFSATRGWLISSIFLTITYSFFLLPKIFRNIMIIVPAIALSIGAAWQIPVVKSQIFKAYNRTVSFENILNPDLNEETTDIGRIRRGAAVMRKYRESPIIGFGLGEIGREHSDGHAGNQSVLLNFGAIGYLLLLNLWLGFCAKMLSAARILRRTRFDFRLYILIALAFTSVFIIHSTSGGFLHPTLGSSATLWYGVIFALGNWLYYNQMQE